MAAQLFSELEQTFARKDDAAVEDVVTRIKVALLDVDPSALDIVPEEYDPALLTSCLLYTSPSPRDMRRSRMPSSA